MTSQGWSSGSAPSWPSDPTLTLSVYRRGRQVAREHGLIVADTKVEFGRRRDGTVVLRR